MLGWILQMFSRVWEIIFSRINILNQTPLAEREILKYPADYVFFVKSDIITISTLPFIICWSIFRFVTLYKINYQY